MSASKRKPLLVKKSYGIILCRNANPPSKPLKLEALLVHKRYTYAFAEFLHGHYSGRDQKKITNILQHMTSEELLDVWSLNFSQMWFRIWVSYDHDNPLYIKKERKFYNVFLKQDRGEYLRSLIKRVTPLGSLFYEIPKGRKNMDKEPEINCAIRELLEETSIPKRNYKIIPHFKKYHSFVHMNVQYDTTYFLAFVKRPGRSFYSINVMNGEVSGAAWMDINKIRLVDNNRRSLETIITPAFHFLRNQFKGKARFDIGISVPHGDHWRKSAAEADRRDRCGSEQDMGKGTKGKV